MYSNCKGHTLIELMIAMTLSMLVMAALVPVNFVALQSVSNVQQIETQLNRLHQSLTLLETDLKSTALTGCAADKSLMINSLNHQHTSITQLQTFQWISGYSNNRWFPEPPMFSNSVEPRTYEALQIVRADMSEPQSATIVTSLPQRILLITNCHYLEITRAIDARLLKSKKPKASLSIYPLQFIHYYVKEIAGTQTLYRQYLSRTGRTVNEPLIDNIKQLRIGYGERLTNNNIEFRPADKVGTWKHVVAIYVKVSLTDALNTPVSMIVPLNNHSYD